MQIQWQKLAHELKDQALGLLSAFLPVSTRWCASAAFSSFASASTPQCSGYGFSTTTTWCPVTRLTPTACSSAACRLSSALVKCLFHTGVESAPLGASFTVNYDKKKEGAVYSQLTRRSHVVPLLSTQAVVSPHPSSVSQLPGPYSYGPVHIAPGQNTDILYLCGFHRKTLKHFMPIVIKHAQTLRRVCIECIIWEVYGIVFVYCVFLLR